MSSNWNSYRPSKGVWLWSCIGAAALTMIVGFGVGGWVTGGTAQERAQASTEDAVATLAANVCTQQVLASADAASIYKELDEAKTWERRKVLEEAGWTTFGDMDKPVSGAASLCATQILAADIPTQVESTTADAEDDTLNEEPVAHDPEGNGVVEEEMETVS